MHTITELNDKIASNEVKLIIDYDDLQVVQDADGKYYYLNYEDYKVEELELVAEVESYEDFDDDALISGNLTKYGLEDYTFDIGGEDSGYYEDHPIYYYFKVKE